MGAWKRRMVGRTRHDLDLPTLWIRTNASVFAKEKRHPLSHRSRASWLPRLVVESKGKDSAGGCGRLLREIAKPVRGEGRSCAGYCSTSQSMASSRVLNCGNSRCEKVLMFS